MRDSTEMRAAVTEYARNFIRERHRAGLTYEQIGEELGVSSAYVQQLNNVRGFASKRVGIELEDTLAQLVHGGSVDALRKAAMHIYGGGRYVADIKGEVSELTSSPTASHSSSPPHPHSPGATTAAGSRRRIKRAKQR